MEDGLIGCGAVGIFVGGIILGFVVNTLVDKSVRRIELARVCQGVRFLARATTSTGRIPDSKRPDERKPSPALLNTSQ